MFAVAPTLAVSLLVPSPATLVRTVTPRRAATVVACDYEDGVMDEYEEALERYRSLGVLDGAGALVEEEDEEDDVTPEQMVEWSARVRSEAGRAANLSMMAAPTRSDFTVENVDRVLDEVRPYLISDGGNVAVVSVDPATMGVSLALQGACGSCPSSTVTMKMGIERVLRENWPSLGAVTQVEDAEEAGEAAEAMLTPAVVEEALSPIMPAIAGLGGKISVLSAEAGVVRLEYTGPEKTKLGIQLSLRDNPLIDQIVFVDPE
jgi:Fe-S cluster biogenesis protein NfuA